ncbi:Endonuclease exonuclease phosphatase [Olea europaea subsp. europaea]|uniref:Endonuclease exonuclease phosphatase n=1 Tax=Olea europaea subsp. europaea TaxID=158383 RepID=A0A8S0QWG1_OLEEU|nr:Endonuclease exonuclease phosphatase [Olea europaea subsp. europaea]
MMRGKSLEISINLKADEEITKKIESICLIGKIMLHKPLDRNLVESIAKKEWKCKNDFSVSCITHNIFMFSFKSKEDLKNVLGDSPWTIRGGLLVLSVWCAGKVPTELSFSYSVFWVQVHGLPINYLSQENVSKIGEYLGIFVCADRTVFDGKFCWRKFLRLRVILDVRNPILTGFWLRRPGLKDIWIDFKYEKLGQFCYKCGRIGNHYLRCKFSAGKAKFGPWLRALPWYEPFSGATFPTNLQEKRGQQNFCTSLIAVPKANSSLIQSSSSLGNLPVMEYATTIEREEESGTTIESEDDKDEDISARNLWRRVIFNGIDSTIMLINCAIIYLRTSSANAIEGNWGLFIMMAAYLFHLTRKLIHVVQRSLFPNEYNVVMPTSVYSWMALMEFVILLVFLLI